MVSHPINRKSGKRYLAINFTGILAALCILLIPFAQAIAADVLLLGDDENEAEVQASLEGAGHAVTYGGIYYDWDGASPDVNNFDVVVLLDGYDYGYDLNPAALTALTNFVSSGGGLVLTEWCAYDVGNGYKTLQFGALMPVEYAGDYDYGFTWNVIDPTHPMVAGVPASWTADGAGSSFVNAKSGSTVLIQSPDNNPLLTYWHYDCGMVVHINNDLGADEGEDTDPNTLVLINNAVSEAADGNICRAAQIPTMTDFGIVIMILLTIGAALWALKANRRETV
jgi:hypothetical protein